MSRLVESIRAAIKASDQTPGAIAKGAGVARSQLSRLLSGERGMSPEGLEQIADYLKLEIIVRPKRTGKAR